MLQLVVKTSLGKGLGSQQPAVLKEKAKPFVSNHSCESHKLATALKTAVSRMHAFLDGSRPETSKEN